MVLLLAVAAAFLFAAHAAWPWFASPTVSLAPMSPSGGSPMSRRDWIERLPRWALAALAVASAAALAALFADVERRLVMGDFWRVPPLRFAAVATFGLALADLVLLVSPREQRDIKGTRLVGVLGIVATFGFCWSFETVRAWGVTNPLTIASAAALTAVAALSVRPLDLRFSRLTALASAIAVLAYAAFGAPEISIAPDAVALRLAPLGVAALLAGAEGWLPRRLRWLARGLAIVLTLISLHSAWTDASESRPFSTRPGPSIPNF